MSQVTGVASVSSYVLRGVTPVPVRVRAEVRTGEIPGMEIQGMRDVEVRSRVRCAMRSTGFEVPRAHVCVTVEPLSIRKVDECLDLPVAVAVLAASGQVPATVADGLALAGALSLDGSVLPVKGTVAMAAAAQEEGLVFVCGEGSRALGLTSAVSAGSLGWARGNENLRLPKGLSTAVETAAETRRGLLLVCEDERGRELCERAARALVETLPGMDADEKAEVATIHDAVGTDAPVGRPVVCVAEGASISSLVGGGRPVVPGSATLATHGALVLGDLLARGRQCVAALVPPRKQGRVTIVRVDGAVTMPTAFLPVAFCPSKVEGAREFARDASERLGMVMVEV